MQAHHRLALVDVNEPAAQAFRAMLKVLDGRTRASWQLVDSLQDAHVVVTSIGSDAAPRWSARADRPVVAIVDSAAVRPRTPWVLTQPFRVMHVLQLLDDIAEQSQARIDTSCRHGPKWAFAHSVRALERASQRGAFYCASAGAAGDVVVAGDLTAWSASPALVDSLRTGTVVLSSLAPIELRLFPPTHVVRPIAELLWHNALHASERLAPWLDAQAAYRLRRWPDFGTIPASRAALQVGAALAHGARTPAAVAHAVAEGPSAAYAVINAMSLCECLSIEAAPRAAVSPPAPRLGSGLLRALVSGLRARLHLAP